MASSTTGMEKDPVANHLPKKSEYIPISDFYAERSIFITGGTGFMGKVLVEKLLRCCPNIENIYLLMRPKRGQDITSRLAELTNSPLFATIRNNRPWELNKIIPIEGDVTEPSLGINPTDEKTLIQKVSIVFHSAATVKFDEKLKLSVAINMLGTDRLARLCQRMHHLEALVHVSTAYCNCDRTVVDEKIYPPPVDPVNIVSMVENMDEELVDHITPKVIGNRPNTYTFTKALAEDMLLKAKLHGDIPIAIVRPSIVLSSLKEPMDGWVDNLNGPTGIMAAVGKGFFRTMHCHGNKVADLVPVDTVINLMVVAAWKTATHKSDDITVYNCCTGQQRPISWKNFVRLYFIYIRKHPFSELMWWPGGDVVSQRFIYSIETVLYHKLPAIILDVIAKALGKKPIMMRIQEKLEKAAICLEFFTTKEWQFRDDNVRQLCNSLSANDKKKFDFDVRNINWETYIQSYVLGIRQFIFKDNPSSLPKARAELNRLYWYHRLTQFFIILCSWRFLFYASPLLKSLWNSIFSRFLQFVRLLPIV